MNKPLENPQKENGHVGIANEIWDKLVKVRIPGEARQVLDAILRKTYGWQKKEDTISLSQFEEMTGIKRPNIVRARGILLKMNIIIVIEKDNGNQLSYRFNKFYSTWKPLSKKITLSKKIIPVIEKDNKPLSKKIHTKDKEENTKEKQKSIAELCSTIIAYLNEKAGKNFSPKTKPTIVAINARLNDGYTLENFKYVIDVKTAQWKGDPEHDKNLNPDTLFRPSKFEKYLNETKPKTEEQKFNEQFKNGRNEWND